MTESERAALIDTIQKNCDISDARDCGSYSLCTLILKLRNHYKWEKDLSPWLETDPPVLLDWVEQKEQYWHTLTDEPFLDLPVNGRAVSPWEVAAINEMLSESGLFYGAGYGRSLKSIFFLADVIDRKTIQGFPVTILGREHARELASPFAFCQERQVFIRRESLRFYFWDQIQEIRSSNKTSLQTALGHYRIMDGDCIDRELFKDRLDTIVDQEMEMFIHHEIGELCQKTFPSESLQKIVRAFPGTAIEYVSRALKDMLADTHPEGLLPFVIERQRISSLAFYVAFLDGLRKVLFPELSCAFSRFLEKGDWEAIREATRQNRRINMERGAFLEQVSRRLDHENREAIRLEIEQKILIPLGLDTTTPQEKQKN